MSGGFKTVVQTDAGPREAYRVAPRYVARNAENGLKKGRRGGKALAKVARYAERYGTKKEAKV